MSSITETLEPVRLQLLSDLHFEFHRDGGLSFVESLDPAGIDVLVLAGDIAVGEGIEGALGLFSERYRDAHILYVHGNHEFYHTTREAVVEHTRRAVAAHPNVVWLDCASVTLGGHRIHGAPLWFSLDPAVAHLRHAMSDFGVISGFESWVYDDNGRATQFLERALAPGDIVVTHHLPAHASVSARFRGHPLTPFFVCDQEALIRERRPRYWLHGHTHDSLNYRLGDTTVLANPFGYVREEENPAFDAGLTIEI